MKRLSYEPLIVHLFKIFRHALKSKSDRSEAKIPASIDNEPCRPPKAHDEQKKKYDEQ